MADLEVTLGLDRRGRPLRKRLRDLTGRNTLIVGHSGSGKSLFAVGLLVESILRDPSVRITCLDAKADTVELFRDQIFPALLPAHPERRFDVGTLEVWGPFVPPFNLFAPIPGMTSDLQGNAVVAAIEKFVGEASFGPRGRPLAIAAARAVIELRGNLLTFRSLLEDPDYRERAAHVVSDPVSRHFLGSVLPGERADSVGAVLARVRGMLGLDRIANIFAAPTSLRGNELIGADFLGIDAGTAPLGEEKLATGFGSWVNRLVSNAIMVATPGRPPVCLVIDEFQRLVSSEDEFLRLLQQCRSRGAALWLITQELHSISPGLRNAILTNCRNVVAMSPNADTLRSLAEYLPRPTGRRVDPLQPDRLLTPAAEQELILRGFSDLPKQHGVYIDVGERARMLAFKARTFPLREFERRAGRAPMALRDQIRQGRFCVPYETLRDATRDPVRERHSGAPVGPLSAPASTEAPADTDAASSPTKRRLRKRS